MITIADLVKMARENAKKFPGYHWRSFLKAPYEDGQAVAVHMTDKPRTADNVHDECECYAIDWKTKTYVKRANHKKWQCPIEKASMVINPDGVVIED